jgi:metal-responsive CopG/Arc/MetJ family transcriptional regulator
MAVLKGEVKRVTLTIPKSFLRDLDSHLKNFALTDRSRWLLDAAKEKLAQEKILLTEIKKEQDE